MHRVFAVSSLSLFLATSSLAAVVTVRSGWNVNVGSNDPATTFLPGPSTGDFNHAFTPTDFSSAQTGPAAFVLPRNPDWISALSTDPLAQWVGTNITAGQSVGSTALYAHSFPTPGPFSSATLTLHYAVDDGLGTVNQGVYLNGVAICGNPPPGFSQEHVVSCDVTSVLRVGTNWLYFDAVNAVGPAGLLFSAVISTVDVFVPSSNPIGNFDAPYGGSLYLRVAGGNFINLEQWQFGIGGTPLNCKVILSGAPASSTEVFAGPVQAGQSIVWCLYTNGFGESGWAFSNGSDLASRVSFTDADNDLGLGGSIYQQTSANTWLMHLGAATAYILFSDLNTDYLIQLRLDPSPPPSPNITTVVNAASFAPGSVAPGGLAAVFGNFPMLAPESASGVPWPTTLGGLSLQFLGGAKAPLVYAAGNQVNIQIPWELTGNTQTSVTAAMNGETTAPQPVRLVPFAPGIFSVNGQGTSQGAILDSSYRLVDSANPARTGDVIQIYCTGLGAVTHQPASGAAAQANPISETTTTPMVSVGGVSARVLFSGLAPGLVGVYQLNVSVPASTPPGNAVPVVLSIGGFTSNTVTIAVQPQAYLNPQPSITGLSPSSAQAGSRPLTLTINGSGFLPSSSVTFNGSPHQVVFLSASQLTVGLSTDLATSGSFPVVVINPSPGGGASNTVNFTVTAAPNPLPSISSLSPASVQAGSGPLTLTINGSDFLPSSSVTFNGTLRTASFVNGGQLSISLAASDVASAGSFAVIVTNPPPGGGSSQPATFSVTQAAMNLTGTWQGAWGSIPVPSAYGGVSAKLTQTGSSVTGSITLTFSDCVPGGDVSGTISGNTVSLSLLVGPPQPLAMFLGEIDASGNSILGAYKVYLGACAGDYGVFTLKRSD